MKYFTPKVNRCCLLCGAKFESGVKPGKRFDLNQVVIYKCGCQVKAIEYGENVFHLSIQNCKVNRLKDAKICEIKFEKINYLNFFEETVTVLHSEKHIKDLKCKKYFVVDYVYIENAGYADVKRGFLVLFTNLNKAKEYCNSTKKKNKGFDDTKAERISKKRIIEKYKNTYSHAMINPGNNDKRTKKTKIVKICDI